MIFLKKLKIAIILSFIFISFGNLVLSDASSFIGYIHKNVYVRDINLSGLNKKEARKKINDKVDEHGSFTLTFNDKNYVFKMEYIDLNYNIDEIIDVAYSIGRSEGIISDFKTKTNLSLGEKVVLDFSYEFDEQKIGRASWRERVLRLV